MVTLLVININ